MRYKNITKLFFVSLLCSFFAFDFCCAKEKESLKNNTSRTIEPQNRKSITESIQPNIISQGEKQVEEKRQKIMQDALSAIQETKNALIALDSNNTNNAIAALERATGKLELILAREPTLALAPVSIDVINHDILVTLKAIENAKKEALKALKDNEIQTARRLIGELGSEKIIRVSNILWQPTPEQ